MHRAPIHRVALAAAAAAALAAAAAGAAAQTPPIKPGLWELKTDRAGEPGTAGRAAAPRPDLSKLPPEARAKVEAMLKQQGVAMTSDGKLRVCLSRESLDKDAWQQNESCRTDYGQRSASVWKWHATCPNAVVDGEAVFESPERYTVRNVVTSQHKGASQRTETTAKAQWVGADCGDIKPMLPARK